jgi:hypothetical protein
MIINNQKKKFISLLVLFSGIGIFLFIKPANASWPSNVISGLLGMIISALGAVLSLVIAALVAVAQYSNFISAPAVSNGWQIVRDVCNMFFIVILLIIAFATILNIESYSYKKWLPKLILMAILINFSKTICGLLIDVAQVVMLTFVNAFKSVAAGNLVDNLGLTKIMTLSEDTKSGVTDTTVVGAYVLGLIYMIISIVVIVTMLAMLVMRVVMIWVYIVLSPAAYLLSAFPGGQKYASEWWSEFTKNLIAGPVLAFFIWLSFASLNNTATVDSFKVDSNTGGDMNKEVKNSWDVSLANTVASTPNAFIKFVIAIGMLIGGLKISQEIGGAAGGIAGKGMAKIQKGTAFATGAIGGFALGKAKSVGRGAKNTALWAGGYAAKGAGSIVGDNKIGNALKSTGDISLQWSKDAVAKTRKIKTDKRQKFLEKMGMGEKTMDKTSEFLKTDAGKEFHTSAHGAGIGALLGSAGGIGGSAIGAGIGFVAGGVASLVPGLLKKFAKRKVESNNSKADIYNQNATNARNIGNTDQADEFKKKADRATQASKRWAGTEKASGYVQSFTSETTQKAAANGSKTIRNARESVKQMATNGGTEFMRDASGGTFYGINADQPKKVIEQLTAPDNADAPVARLNAENWVNSLNNDPSNHDLDLLRGLAKGIAAADKGGMDVSSLSGIIAAINSKSGLGDADHGLNGQTVEGLKPSVIAYRNTGQIGEQGSGEFAVDTFAKNDANEGGKNIIGVDFNKLKGAGVDVKAEANFSSGEAMSPLIKAVSDQIDNEKSELSKQSAAGNISNTEYVTKNDELNNAKRRLNDPNLKNLNLVNTASANYGRQQKMTSAYHEEIHAGGVQDEDLTENISKNLMENKLYGRNAATGGRHATEIAQKAKAMKDEGKSNEEIMTEVDKDVKSRVNTEGKNRAERVARLQSGEKETESQAVEEVAGESAGKKKDKSEEPNINTEELQAGIDKLTSKFEAMAASFSPKIAVGGQSSIDYRSLTYPLKQLNLNMRKNTSLLRKMTNGKAPTTVIEAGAINDEILGQAS